MSQHAAVKSAVIAPQVHHAGADDGVVHLSSTRFLMGCALAAEAIILISLFYTLPSWVLAAEVFATVLALFAFGSIRYRLDKNALTYGSGLVALATFLGAWWPTSPLRTEVAMHGAEAWWPGLNHYLLTFHGLNELIHLDTMLFILGLTFFVSVIAQTRLLEGITFFMLRRNGGRVLPTVICITAVVALASGILDGVSMIGLTIRTLAIILILARVSAADMRFAVIMCTAVTTVNGIWLAYGEPPNLIMKANLAPHLTDKFFLTYCGPAAVATYLVVAFFLTKRLRGKRVDLKGMDVMDCNSGTIRFAQATRHGHVFSPSHFIEDRAELLGRASERIAAGIRDGQSMGRAMVRENVPEPVRVKLLSEFATPELAPALDRHYRLLEAGDAAGAAAARSEVETTLKSMGGRKSLAQIAGGVALVAFMAGLIMHAMHHEIPLFAASFAGFAVAFLGIAAIPSMRRLALHEGKHEYSEYLFLIPLFLSISLLAKVGFFDDLQVMVHYGIQKLGHSHMAVAQFLGAAGLSALLDNNVVADFMARTLRGMPEAAMFLFALAQIAGYAAGGCWTHIGSAQSVVAYSFIQRDIDRGYTPFNWIRDMTPVLLTMVGVLTLLIYIVSFIAL